MQIRNVRWNADMIIRILVALQLFYSTCVCQITPNPDNNKDFELNYTATAKSIIFETEYDGFSLIDVKCSSIGDISTRSATKICDKLESCAQYYVIAEIQNLKTNSTFKEEDVIETTYDEPNTDFSVIIPYPTSIYVSWTSMNRKCISKIIIRADSENSQYKTEINDGKENIEISDLLPCKSYRLALSVEDIMSTMVKNITRNERTVFTDPGPVQNVIIDTTEDDSVIIKWSPPHYATCADFYYITWDNLNCTSIIDECSSFANISSSDQQIIIQNLEGCQSYGLSIYVNGALINSSYYEEFSTKSLASGPVKNLRETQSTNSSVTVEWDPPERNSHCIKSYKLQISNNPEPYQTTDTTWTFMDLEPCGKYTITVTSVTDYQIESQPVELDVITLYAKPSPVQFDFNQSAAYVREILLFWKPPEYAALCVQFYRVVVWYTDNNDKLIQNYSNETDKTDIRINELLSCMMYIVQVIAVTGGDQSLESLPAQTNFSTKATIPKDPSEPELWDVTGTSLEVSSFSFDETTNCQILYVQIVCDATSPAEIKSAKVDMEVNNLNNVRFVFQVEPLSPVIQYECKVSTYNSEGWSSKIPGAFTTLEYFPEPPTNVKVIATSASEIIVKWNEPRISNGKIVLYKIHIQTIQAKYKIPSYCTPIEFQSLTQTIEASKMEFPFQAAHPYVEYSVQISAINSFGASDFTAPVRITTLPSYSEPVLYFSASTMGPKLSEEYEANVTLKWRLPCRANGEIITFEGTFMGTREGFPNDIFSWEMPVKKNLLDETDSFEWIDTRLKPEYNYSVTIIVIVEDGTQPSRVMSAKFLAPSGIPPIPTDVDFDVDAFDASNPTSSAVLKFPKKVFTNNMGSILYIALLISEEACRVEPESRYALLDSETDWPEVETWGQVQSKACMTQYQTTQERWPVEGILKQDPESEYVEYTIGKDSCENIDINFFCNGPLRPGGSYSLILRLFTSSGYSDTGFYTFKTDSAIQMYFILLLIISCLFVAFLLGFIYLWVTKKIIWHGEQFRGGEETAGDISSKNFFNYYDEIAKSEKVHREFKELTAISNELNLSNVASTTNETKNRYSNIFPYDKNRVILDCDFDGSDYINASFINGYKRKKEYIATQGPKPESFVDFWRMILQHNVRLIVMVTQMKEGDVVKCHQYFPILNKEMAFGHNITVSCKREAIHQNFERRELVLEHRNDCIKTNVIHYYFKKWPDHDCPEDAADLIQFVRKVRSEKIKKHSPITVHCSAGVGRTGTFIGLDIIMQRLKYENRINIYETVRNLRFQRMKMVQTIQQYQFLYNCTYQLIKKKYTTKTKKTTNKTELIMANGSAHHESLRTPNEAESVM